MDAMETAQDAFLAGLQLYFLLMNWTVERSYCEAPITEASDCFLCAETFEFCTAHNPLFLARPEWLRLATCFSAYAFCLGYLIVLYAAVTDSWAKLRHPILLFLGAKLYALVYYHTLEFASATPPRGLRAYFGVEGPYVLAGALVLRKVLGGGLNALRARRSVVKYSSKSVPAAATRRALEAAIQAPNHFLSEPWRFYTAGPATKAKLCGLNEDKRKAAEAVPEWLIVTCASEHKLSEKLGLEDHAACACAVQNFMLSLAGEGIGSKWMTGALGAPPEAVLKCVGATNEKLMGAIWYGYPAKALSDGAKTPRRKKGVDGVLTKCA
jgi:nitroreductase